MLSNPQIRTIILITILMILFLAIGYLLGGKIGLVIALALGFLVNFISYYYAKEIVLNSYPVEPIEDKEIIEMVKQLTLKAKMPLPELYYALVDYPNAFATGRNPENSAVVITKPLVDILNKKELKAVIAHELGHIYNRDVLIQTIVAAIGTALTFFIEMAFWFRNDEEEVSWWQILLIYLAAMIIIPLIQFAISRQREYLADEFSAKLTCNPDALASALKKIEDWYLSIQEEKDTSLLIKPSHQHLMIFSPSELFSTHPPTEKRIERLMKLKKELRC
jgi:heat shock protein HtpX